jgi:5'-methylthioadenosine phosphorylase
MVSVQHGGSGLYEMEGLKNVRQVVVRTPFGAPSDAITVGELEGRTLAFLPRHGRGHRISPSQINYRANVYAMKKIGADSILSISAVGSMKEKIRPGDIVVVDQFFDHTRFRPNTFFSDGVAGHVAFADPVVPGWPAPPTPPRGKSFGGSTRRNVPLHGGARLLHARRIRNLPEMGCRRHRDDEHARGETRPRSGDLLRDARAGDRLRLLACHPEDVSVEAILEVLRRNVENSKRIVREVALRLPLAGGCGCGEALRFALITDPKRIPAAARKRLSLLIGKYL